MVWSTSLALAQEVVREDGDQAVFAAQRTINMERDDIAKHVHKRSTCMRRNLRSIGVGQFANRRGGQTPYKSKPACLVARCQRHALGGTEETAASSERFAGTDNHHLFALLYHFLSADHSCHHQRPANRYLHALQSVCVHVLSCCATSAFARN